MHYEAWLALLRKLGIIFFFYLAVFALLYALDYRPAKLVFALSGMALLAGALALPFLRAQDRRWRSGEHRVGERGSCRWSP